MGSRVQMGRRQGACERGAGSKEAGVRDLLRERQDNEIEGLRPHPRHHIGFITIEMPVLANR